MAKEERIDEPPRTRRDAGRVLPGAAGEGAGAPAGRDVHLHRVLPRQPPGRVRIRRSTSPLRARLRRDAAGAAARARRAGVAARPPRLLRALGDSALFTSGFFADSLQGGLVNLGYYKDLGGQAYLVSPARKGPVERQRVLQLAARFGQFADVLPRWRSRAGWSVTADPGALRALGADGEPPAAALLAERGITLCRRRGAPAVTDAGAHGVLIDVQRRLEGFYGLPAPAVSGLIPAQAAPGTPARQPPPARRGRRRPRSCCWSRPSSSA